MDAQQFFVTSSPAAIPLLIFFFFQAEAGIRARTVTGVQTCALTISATPAEGDDGTTAWSCPPPREANYAAIVNLGCGDLVRSLQEAKRADEAWSAGDPWVYGTWAQVRIGAAIAHVRDGEADGAAEEIAPVLGIPAEYRVVTITDRLGYVGQLLRGPRHRGSPAAADLREQIGEFRAASLRVKAISAAESQ